MATSAPITVYEQERQKNIERNKTLLAELGLGEARRQLIETHVSTSPQEKKEVDKTKRRYTKKTFMIETPRRSARIQGKPVRYSDDFGSEEGEEERKMGKRKYSFYDIEDEARPKYKNELTTCHFCRKRDRKPKTRCGTCGVKYWVGDCCRSCFEQHFEDEDFDEVMMNKDWVCYCCRKKCPCMECIAGITKGRRYGPRKFKDSPTKDDYSAVMPFGGVPAEQYNLFSPLPLPSFFNYPHSNAGISQFSLPMPTSHYTSSLASPPSPPSYSHGTSFSSYPTPSLFPSSHPASHGSNCSNYTGGFPALQSAFGGGGGCVSPQNIFGMPPLPPPNPHPHYMGGHSYLNGNRGGDPSLDNGAACGYKMAQVIAQITNTPNYTNSSSFTFPPPPPPPMINNNPFPAPPLKKKRGRKPKGFMFGLHSESVSSDPMNTNDMMFDQPLDILPPIKLPQKRGRKPKSYLPALSVEEEALSASMGGLSNDEEQQHQQQQLHHLADDEMNTEEPLLDNNNNNNNNNHSNNINNSTNNITTHKKKRMRKPKTEPLSTSLDGARAVFPSTKRTITRKPKIESGDLLPSLPNMLDASSAEAAPLSPSSSSTTSSAASSSHYSEHHHHPHHFSTNKDEEFFHPGVVNDDLLNTIDTDIFNDFEDYGFMPQEVGEGEDDANDGDEEGEGDEEDGNVMDFETSAGVENPGNNTESNGVSKKRGRPKKPNSTSKIGGVGGSSSNVANKRKYTKRPATAATAVAVAEGTAILRRSARPPRASRAFDDHYLL